MQALSSAIRRWLLGFAVVRWLQAELVAALHRFSPTRASYSQNREDAIVAGLLHAEGVDPARATYVDVGANHPTRLSNTYLLYRLGARGITIDPDADNLSLHRRHRPGDRQILCGCGEENVLLEFRRHRYSVLSGFADREATREGVIELRHMPVLTLDTIVHSVGCQVIDVLSVDVEGMDLQVLKGGPVALGRARVIVIEFGEEAAEIEGLLERAGFAVRCRTEHNLIACKLATRAAGSGAGGQ